MPVIPAAMNLGDPLVMIPSRFGKEPREGRNSITFVTEWSKPLAKGLRAININLQNNATLEFSQINGLIVDNSDCGCDLDFIFPDTNVTVSIPAYAPYTVLAVETNQVQFFIVAAGAIAGDVTRTSILNFTPAPVAVPIFIQQNVASIGNVTMDGVSTTAIIPAGINGSLRVANVVVAFPQPSVSFNNLLSLEDGNGAIMWRGNVAAQNTSPGGTGLICNLQSVSIRFSNGVNLVQSGGFAPGATISANLYYVKP